MLNIIEIGKTTIDGAEINSVNARDIYIYLEVKSDYKNWIKRAINKYLFEDGVDFISVKNDLNKSRGRKSIDHIVSIDMAKELCMVSNTAKGKETRKYFIESEKINTKPMTMMEMVAQNALSAVEQEKRLALLEEKQEDLQDAVIDAIEELADRIEHTNGLENYFTIIGYLNYRNKKTVDKVEASRHGKRVTKMCDARGLNTGVVPDARFGRVKTYPCDILDEYFL